MKTFIISAIIGLTAIGLKGINAAAIPELDVADVKRAPQEHCWEAPDGQIHCSLDKRAPQEHCWEAPDGQIHCSLTKRDPQEHCWEAPDGQIHCSLDKRDALPQPKKGKHGVDTHYPSCGAPICRRVTFNKRDAAEQCWEAPDGQIHCSLDKRVPQEHCWETPDGQIQCSLKKRQEHCWEAPDGQIHCSFAMEMKRDASPESLVLPPPAPIINGTSRQCASWWVVVNLEGQPDPCLAALVSAQNITFAQFRQLNPDVNSTCTNLHVGYAYCVQGIQAFNTSFPSFANVSNAISTQSVSSTASLLPALRVTEARNGTRGHGLPAPTPVSQGRFDPNSTGIVSDTITTPPSAPLLASMTNFPSSECTLLTYGFGSGTTIYAIDSSLHICQTQIFPNGTIYHPSQPETTAAVGSATSLTEASKPTQSADNGRLSSFEPTATG
ncbi:MAG: hypothetical protein LQ343_003714 [Gyalolechia ehrenbergii]|nr:MAG: hypothetical protein LQ343_003714 [Gyalolechia ehrenbergii]